MQKRHVIASAVLASALLMSGCSDSGNTPSAQEQQKSDFFVKDGYISAPQIEKLSLGHVDYSLTIDNELKKARVDILRADKKGDTLRVIGAFQKDKDSSLALTDFGEIPLDSSSVHPFVTGEIWDTKNGTIAKPLTQNRIPFTTHAEPFQGADVELFYLDFPAPEGEKVKIRIGKFGDFSNAVPVSESSEFVVSDERAMNFGAPPKKQMSTLQGDVLAENKDRTQSVQENIYAVSGSSQRWKDGQFSLSIDSDILFDLGSDELTEEAQKIIADSAKTLRLTAEGQTVKVVGHTDNKGTAKFNDDLSKRRAESVLNAVSPLLKGADVTLTSEGRGSHDPLVPNTDSQGREIEGNQAKNRRVSFEYKPTVQESATVDTGTRTLLDAPKAEKIEPKDGALESFVVQQKDDAIPMRIDIVEAQKTPEGYLRLGFRYSLHNSEDADRTVWASMSPFGDNGFGALSLPGASNISILQNGMQYAPISAGEDSCLCSEELPVKATLADGESNTVFAYYPLGRVLPAEAGIRFANAGEAEVDINSLLQRGSKD